MSDQHHITDGLPEQFSTQNEDHSWTHETRPCYELQQDGYYGDTLFFENEIITTEMVPNNSMKPLNRAAGARYVAWIESLPLGASINVNIGDITEAATMLRNDPEVKDLSHEAFSKAVTSLALHLKAKRDDRHYIPPIAGGPQMTGRGKAPPMSNARFTDPSHRGMGATREPDILHEPKRSINPVQRAKPATGATPAAR